MWFSCDSRGILVGFSYIIYDLAFSKECQPPGRRIQILAVKIRRKKKKISFHKKNLNLKKCFCLKHISSCWMKIWGTIKSKDGDERRKKKRRRANVSVNNGPALVPGVFFSLSLYVYCFSPPLRNTKEAEILFAPIFCYNWTFFTFYWQCFYQIWHIQLLLS